MHSRLEARTAALCRNWDAQDMAVVPVCPFSPIRCVVPVRAEVELRELAREESLLAQCRAKDGTHGA